MEREDLIYIQERIQYNFKKSTLLQQAFIRRSYSKENPKWQDNEILELIGDSELGAFIIRKLCKEFGRIDDDQFYCNKKEGDLTKLKSNYVDKESLAHCIEMLGFNNFLIMATKSYIWFSPHELSKVKRMILYSGLINLLSCIIITILS